MSVEDIVISWANFWDRGGGIFHRSSVYGPETYRRASCDYCTLSMPLVMSRDHLGHNTHAVSENLGQEDKFIQQCGAGYSSYHLDSNLKDY